MEKKSLLGLIVLIVTLTLAYTTFIINPIVLSVFTPTSPRYINPWWFWEELIKTIAFILYFVYLSVLGVAGIKLVKHT